MLTELGAKDSTGPMLPTFSPFTRRIQLMTTPKKFMMPTLVVYEGDGNP